MESKSKHKGIKREKPGEQSRGFNKILLRFPKNEEEEEEEVPEDERARSKG